jgi:hypothetical protein
LDYYHRLERERIHLLLLDDVRRSLPDIEAGRTAKFIPGFSTVAPPIAGGLHMRQASFLIASAAGGALWAGVALCAGWVLRDEVDALIASEADMRHSSPPSRGGHGQRVGTARRV